MGLTLKAGKKHLLKASVFTIQEGMRSFSDGEKREESSSREHGNSGLSRK